MSLSIKTQNININYAYPNTNPSKTFAFLKCLFLGAVHTTKINFSDTKKKSKPGNMIA